MTVLENGDDVTAPFVSDLATPRAARRRIPIGGHLGVLIALILCCVYLASTQSAFRTWGNVTNIVGSNSVTLVLALGATYVIIAGGLDMSIAAGTAATGMILGLVVQAGAPLILVLLAPIGFGLLIGFINGALITFGRISFLVVTLGALSIYTSFALIVKSGSTIVVFDNPTFNPVYDFATHKVGPIPIVMIFDVIISLVAAGVLRYTSFGRSVFAVGSNREAARLNGINVTMVVLMVYVITGLTVGLASIVEVGRLTGASPTVDPTLLLGVLAAVLIGGTAYTGGSGSIIGTIIGVLFLGVVQNGLTIVGVSSFWQGMVNGLILIAAVGIGVLREHGRFFLRRPRRRAEPAPSSPA
jgi:ribose transport system permease protein